MHRVLRRKEYVDFLLGKTISWNLKNKKKIFVDADVAT